MSEINHEAAKNVCHARLAQDMHPSSSDRNIARAYLDMVAQRDAAQAAYEAERARVEAFCDAIHDANGVAFPFEDMQNKMNIILEGCNAHAAQGDEG